MATIDLQESSPNGWKKWIYVKNTISSKHIILSDDSFPYVYLPSEGFRIRSLVGNCLISWLNVDPYLAYTTVGGGTFTLAGQLAGVQAYASLVDIAAASATFGLGGRYSGPQTGYCIGNKFHQYLYVAFQVLNGGPYNVIVANMRTEVTLNSRFKRLYLVQGQVSSYSVVGTEHILRLDINNSNAPVNENILNGTSISIVSGSTSLSVNIKEVKPNWDLVIADPGKNTPKAGDYYYLDSPACLEDPYLITGDFLGPESKTTASKVSQYDLYKTSRNSPYEAGKFTGAYVWSAKNAQNVTASTASATIPEARAIQPVYGSSMVDDEQSTWAFLGTNQAKTFYPDFPYPDDIRYQAVKVDLTKTSTTTTLKGSTVGDIDNLAVTVYVERQKASAGDYGKVKDDKNTEYIRAEISSGGGPHRNNWHAPCLQGQYVRCGGNIFKIIAHVESNVIDVAKKSVTGGATFDPISNVDYEIVNQYAWTISEHYNRAPNAISGGMFQGKLTSSSTGSASYQAKDLPQNTVILGLVSFSQRYREDIQASKNVSKKLKAGYKKYQNWRIVDGTGKESLVDTITIASDGVADSNQYNISVSLKNKQEVINAGNVYLIFDESYVVFGGRPKTTMTNTIEGKASLSSVTNPYVTSDQLCLEGEIIGAPYKLKLGSGDRIGFCGNYLFGVTNAVASNPNGSTIMVSTPGAALGIGSTFHSFKQEDWAAFNDPITGKINIRKGQLSFKEYPNKSLVAIGRSEVVSISGSPIMLDETKDWLGRMQLKMPRGSKESQATDFATGNENNIYGFYVSGDGGVNLPALDTPTRKSTDIPINTWMGDGHFVSPVFAYKTGGIQGLEQVMVDMSINTKSGPVYIKQGAVSEAYVQYYKEKQVLGNLGHYDIFRGNDGEMLFVYGIEMLPFKVKETGQLTNSNDNNTAWTDKNAVMLVGSPDDGLTWTTPLAKKIDGKSVGSNPDAYNDPLPMMILSGCDYLSSIYNHHSWQVSVFIKGYKSGKMFIGCYTFAAGSLNYKLSLCNSVDTINQMDFWYRNPAIASSTIKDVTKNWTDVKNIVTTGSAYDPEKDSDRFVRIMGENGTDSKIEYTEETGVISTSLTPNGSFILLFDSEEGVLGCFSSDGGEKWYKSNVITVRNARSGIVVGGLLFAIGSSGIVVKKTVYMHFYNLLAAAAKNAGKGDKNLETELQIEFDKLTPKLIGSGQIEPQKLTGYVDHTGVVKIFFYDTNNLLKCIQSSDTDRWTVASNF